MQYPRAQNIKGQIGGEKVRVFQSDATAGTGVAQDIAHGLGQAPSAVIVSVTKGHDGAAGAGIQVPDITLGAHDATNCVVTCTAGAEFYVVAF